MDQARPTIATRGITSAPISPATAAGWPALEELEHGLRQALGKTAEGPSSLRVVHRQLPDIASQFPGEIVTYELADGRQTVAFCKYQHGPVDTAFGHRGGVLREVEVHRSVLQPLGFRKPALLGFLRDSTKTRAWLMLEFLDGCTRLNHAVDAALVASAGTWLARFHDLAMPLISQDGLSELPRYNPTYYQGWVDRTVTFASELALKVPWLRSVTHSSSVFINVLIGSPLTVIHGEFYGANVLTCGGKVFPIDWETAAVAAPEIDLASLVDGWPSNYVRTATEAYIASRFPAGPPADFRSRLEAARMYLQFRWLGERREWTQSAELQWRWQELKKSALLLGAT